MKNNKVIIDEVEVQDCTYIIKGCNECKMDYLAEINTQEELSIIYRNCKGLKNCYYKQLARKTQECEKLKEELTSSEKWRISAENALEKLDLKIGKLNSALDEIKEIINRSDLAGILTGDFDLPSESVNQIREILTKAKEQK